MNLCIFVENMLVSLDVLNAFSVKEGFLFHIQLHKRLLTLCNDDGLVTFLNLPVSATDSLGFCVLRQLPKVSKDRLITFSLENKVLHSS